MKIDESVSMRDLAHLTPGYVGADLHAFVREASLFAVNRLVDQLLTFCLLESVWFRIFETSASQSQPISDSMCRLSIEGVSQELRNCKQPFVRGFVMCQ